MSKHPMPWRSVDLYAIVSDHHGVSQLYDADGRCVIAADNDLAARIVALTKVVVAAKEFQEAYDKNHRVIIKRLNLYAKLAELEALP
jgi:hypothetical protein